MISHFHKSKKHALITNNRSPKNLEVLVHLNDESSSCLVVERISLLKDRHNQRGDEKEILSESFTPNSTLTGRSHLSGVEPIYDEEKIQQLFEELFGGIHSNKINKNMQIDEVYKRGKDDGHH